MTGALALAAGAVLGLVAAPLADGASDLEQTIWKLLDDDRSPYVSLPESDFRALGTGFDPPDGGNAVTDLALNAPGGAFDPRDVDKIDPRTLGHKADWIDERYKRDNLDWDITGLRLTSLNPDAKKYPWFIINGGAANLYELFVDLKNRPGCAQYFAQKLDVMVVTSPANFTYGGREDPIQSLQCQPAYLLDRDLSMQASEVRNVLYTNALLMQGLKALLMKHTEGEILISGHSTSGELAMLANDDPGLRARLNGGFCRWGSGGPARLDLVREVKDPTSVGRGGVAPATARKPVPLHRLARRDPNSYSHGDSGFLNPLHEPGMSHHQIAERWLEVELQDLLKKTGHPWGVNLEDVSKDLCVTHDTRLDGYK